MNKLIISIVCFFTVIVLGILVIFPGYQAVKLNQTVIKEKNDELLQQKAYYDELASISEKLKQYSDVLSKIDLALSQDLSLPLMYDYLQKKTSESGLILKQISEVSTTQSKENPRLKVYTINLTLSGSYSSCKNFISLLEKSSRLIEIDSISLSYPSAAKNQPLSIVLDLKFYSY